VIEETSTPLGGGPAVCPFVAFEDDRDHRSNAPDYRHRCFASAEPEPRAFPHQERYCLASDFAECPVFLDWARQEAAGVAAANAAAGADAVVAESTGADETAPAFLNRRARPEPMLPAGAGRRSSTSSANLWSYEGETSRSPAPMAPPAPSSLAQPMVAMARRGPSHPGWENPPRVENFPRLRAREDHRANQPLLAAALGVALLMVALILIPILTSGRGTTGNNPSPSGDASGAVPTALSSPTPTAAASFLRYRVQSGDNLYSIASRFNLHLWEIELANPDITDFNHLSIGQILDIPPVGLLTRPPATAAPAGS
jgi:LysM repeat protein